MSDYDAHAANAMCKIAAAVRKLAAEVMAFEEGLPIDSLSAGEPTWPHERRRRWRSLLETTTRMPDVSAGFNEILYTSTLLPPQCRTAGKARPCEMHSSS